MTEQSSSEPKGASTGRVKLDLHSRLVIGSCILLVLTLVATERAVILKIADPDTFPPSLLWQLLWPVGLVALALPLPRPAMCLFLWVVGGLSVALLAADSAYFQFFGTVTSAFMVTSLPQLLDVHDSVTEVLSLSQFLPALLFLPLLVLAVRDLRRQRTAPSPVTTGTWPTLQRRGVLSAGLALLCLAMGLTAWNIPVYEKTHHLGRSEWVKPAEHWTSQYSRSSHAATFGIFNYHAQDFFEAVQERIRTVPLDAERKEELRALLDHKQALNTQASPLWGVARGRHVILLQLESLQRFLLNLEVGGQAVMPVLDGLQRDGLSFDTIFDVTKIGRTSDAEFAVMTGLLPDEKRAVAYFALSPSLTALPKELRGIGYQTTSIHAYKPAFWNRAVTHPAYGIDDFHFQDRFEGLAKMGLGASDKDVFAYSARLLAERRDRPQFFFVISLSSHHPYLYVPPSYREPYSHLSLEEFGLSSAYLASATYTDEAVGSFLTDLQERGLARDSLIVIYGDHDRGGLGTTKPIPEVGPRMMQVTEDRIPMLILVPGKEHLLRQHAARYRQVMGGLQDLAPTLLHLLGEATPRGMMGTHWFVPSDQRDPFPHPDMPGLFLYRDALVFPNGQIVRAPGSLPELGPVPTLAEGRRDQDAVQDLLVHYDEVLQQAP